MRFNVALARRVALILGLSFPTFCNALADGRAMLPPRWMVDAYLSDALVKPSRDDIARAIIPGLGMVPAFLGGFAGLAGATTLNPSDKTSGITLSGGNLIATTTAANQGVRAIQGRNTGKFYFEVTINANPSSATIGIGAITTSVALTAVPPTQGFLWRSGNGGITGDDVNSGGGADGGSYTSGDVLRIAMNIGGARIYVGKNGSWYGSQNPVAETGGITIVTRTLYPWVQFDGYLVHGDQVTFNFGATPFAYPVPPAFTPGFA